MHRSLVIALATGIALAVLPTTAYAEPTDPAPGWATQSTEGEVLAVPSGGGVHLVTHDNFDSSAHLRHSTNGTWSAATQTDFIRPQLGTSSYDDYAVLIGERAIWDDGIYHHQVVSRVFSEGAWGPEVVVGEFDDANINMRTWLDTNYWGDAVVAWSPYPGGEVQAAVLRRGGTWQTSTTPLVIDEAKYLRYRLPQPVINNSRKVSLVWFEPTESTYGKAMRSVLPADSTTWTPARPITSALITDPARVDTDTDGQGRETVAVGSRVYRQVSSTSGFRYQFLETGVQAIDIAAHGPRTRLVWSVRNGRTFTLKTRLIFGDELRPTRAVATKTFAASVPADCLRRVEPAAGLAPEGRSYLAWGVATSADEGDECPASGFAQVAAVNGADKVLGSHAIRLVNGGGFRVSLSDHGPITVSYLGSYQPGTGWGENHRAVFLSR